MRKSKRGLRTTCPKVLCPTIQLFAWLGRERDALDHSRRFGDDVRYALIPAFVFDFTPAEQPMRRIVAEHRKPIWSYKVDHVWELRLYENPSFLARDDATWKLASPSS